MQTLAEWLAHCEQLHTRPIDLGLERVRQVAERMQLRFDCTVITVAGTNGKGSTCAMLESIAGQAGWRTGVYTSPHLVHFEERCRIAGQPVSEAALLPQFARVEAARGETTLSYFEFTTLAILGCMADAKLDLAVLEVGLGGRLDAVNVIDADCAVITSIDLDHMEFLGPDRESIGFEKAGILRPGRPAVVSDPVPPASIARHAQGLVRVGQAELHVLPFLAAAIHRAEAHVARGVADRQQRAQAFQVGVVGVGAAFQRGRPGHLLEGGVERGGTGIGRFLRAGVLHRRGKRCRRPRQQRGQQACLEHVRLRCHPLPVRRTDPTP